MICQPGARPCAEAARLHPAETWEEITLRMLIFLTMRRKEILHPRMLIFPPEGREKECWIHVCSSSPKWKGKESRTQGYFISQGMEGRGKLASTMLHLLRAGEKKAGPEDAHLPKVQANPEHRHPEREGADLT